MAEDDGVFEPGEGKGCALGLDERVDGVDGEGMVRDDDFVRFGGRIGCGFDLEWFGFGGGEEGGVVFGRHIDNMLGFHCELVVS